MLPREGSAAAALGSRTSGRSAVHPAHDSHHLRLRPDQPMWPYAKGVCTGIHTGTWLPLSLHTPFHTTLACHQAVTINLTLFCMIALWESYQKGITFKIFRCLFYSLLLEPAAITKLYIIELCREWMLEMDRSVCSSWTLERGLSTEQETQC